MPLRGCDGAGLRGRAWDVGRGATLTQKGIFLLVKAEMHSPVSVSHSLQNRSYEQVTKRRPSLVKAMSRTAAAWPM